MSEIKGICAGKTIRIHPDRKVVLCDGLERSCRWKEGDGYFLVRIQDGLICVGWVDGSHEMHIEFRGSDPETLIDEVVRQDFVDKHTAAYIASEIMLAHRCLAQGEDYTQR